MKKIFIVIGAFLFILVSTNIFARSVGKQIYERAFGRGCGTCHDNSDYPQLTKLIQAGELDIESFTNTLINGKNDMPAAMDALMAVGPVKKAGYTEEQAINAVYKYLGGEINDSLLSKEDKDNAIILNQDFSFIIPLIKYLEPNGSEIYYNVGFSFVPRANQLLFEPTSITKCGVQMCSQDEETAIILNQDFSFNIPVIKYIDTNDFEHYYNVDFSFTPSDTRMLFEPIKITEVQ